MKRMGLVTSRIVLKSPREIDLMRAAGGLVCDVLDAVSERVAVGVTTAHLDEIAEKMIRDAGGKALFKGVVNPDAAFPFPSCICASVNEEVVHGIPDDRPLQAGDVVSIDCGVRLRGYCGDSARTFPVGETPQRTQNLLDVTRETLELALREARPGRRWSEIAREMQQHVQRANFGVVRQFVGHGIGREMHEEPKVPNYVERRELAEDFVLQPGMTIAVEPMVTAGRPEVTYKDSDRWAVITKDHAPAAHFEHSIAITDDGVTVLTARA